MDDANSDSEIEDTVKKKTLSIYFNKQSHVNNILFSLSSITKNIYSTTIEGKNIMNPVTIKIITGRLIKLSRDVELRNQRVKGKW